MQESNLPLIPSYACVELGFIVQSRLQNPSKFSEGLLISISCAELTKTVKSDIMLQELISLSNRIDSTFQAVESLNLKSPLQLEIIRECLTVSITVQ